MTDPIKLLNKPQKVASMFEVRDGTRVVEHVRGDAHLLVERRRAPSDDVRTFPTPELYRPLISGDEAAIADASSMPCCSCHDCSAKRTGRPSRARWLATNVFQIPYDSRCAGSTTTCVT